MAIAFLLPQSPPFCSLPEGLGHPWQLGTPLLGARAVQGWGKQPGRWELVQREQQTLCWDQIPPPHTGTGQAGRDARPEGCPGRMGRGGVGMSWQLPPCTDPALALPVASPSSRLVFPPSLLSLRSSQRCEPEEEVSPHPCASSGPSVEALPTLPPTSHWSPAAVAFGATADLGSHHGPKFQSTSPSPSPLGCGGPGAEQGRV